MDNRGEMQNVINRILLIGVLLSSLLVTIGGSLYLYQSGHDPIPHALHINSAAEQSIQQVIRYAFTFTPLGMVELGLLLLVATQSLRVALLLGFYTLTRDYKFASISAFILIMLIYSAFWGG